jgi:putative hydrolase of the HAD superfamily
MTKTLTHPKGILFDLGDTLLKANGFDLDGGIKRLLSLTDQADLFDQSETKSKSEVLYNGIAYSFENSRKHGDLLGKASERIRFDSNYEVSFTAFHRNLFDRMGLTSQHDWATLDLEFLKISHIFDKEDYVIEMLTRLKQENIRMGVVSNSFHGGKSLEWMLEKAGMHHFFDFLISSADYGFRKPHPELFETAIARLGLPREHLWFIGDRLDADVIGANSVGLTSVWYNADSEPATEITPDLTVKSWVEFEQIITKLWTI